jgi:hypothetical protein
VSANEVQFTEKANVLMVSIRGEIWRALLKIAGRHIDPETAGVCWEYALTLDPYGVYPDLPEEYQQVGRAHFARSPGSDIWVEFGDLPVATRQALWTRAGRPPSINDDEVPF